MLDMKCLVFILDDRYISEVVCGDVEQVMIGFFLELVFEQLFIRNIFIEMLFDILKSYDKIMGFIYYFWFEIYNQDDNNYLFDYIQEIIICFVYFFLFLLVFEDLFNNIFVGGYYVLVEFFGDLLLQLIYCVLEGEFL